MVDWAERFGERQCWRWPVEEKYPVLLDKTRWAVVLTIDSSVRFSSPLDGEIANVHSISLAGLHR